MLMMSGIMARMVPSQALTSAVPELHDRGAFMSINSSLQQIAGGVAAIIGGKIVWQINPNSPLMNFELLGWVVVAVILVNILLTKRVYNYVSKK